MTAVENNTVYCRLSGVTRPLIERQDAAVAVFNDAQRAHGSQCVSRTRQLTAVCRNDVSDDRALDDRSCRYHGT